MAFTLEYSTRSTSEEILAAIRREGAYWQESRVPHQLQSERVIAVDADIRPPQFRLRCAYGFGAGHDWYDLRGRVETLPDGRRRVVARVGLKPELGWIPAIPALLGIWMILNRTAGGAILLVGAAGLATLYYAYDRAASRHGGGTAEHLADCLDRAMATLPGSA